MRVHSIVAVMWCLVLAESASAQEVTTDYPARRCDAEYPAVPPTSESSVLDIAERRPNEVFALGVRRLLRYDGHAWRPITSTGTRTPSPMESITYTQLWRIGRELWAGSMFSWSGERGQHCVGTCNRECSRPSPVPDTIALLGRLQGDHLVPVHVPRAAGGMISAVTYGEAVMRVVHLDPQTTWVITNVRVIEMIGTRYRRDLPLEVAEHAPSSPTAMLPAHVNPTYNVLRSLTTSNRDAWMLLETPIGNVVTRTHGSRTQMFAGSSWLSSAEGYVRSPSGRVLAVNSLGSLADGTNRFVELTANGPIHRDVQLGGSVGALVRGEHQVWSLGIGNGEVFMMDAEVEHTLQRFPLAHAEGFAGEMRVVPAGPDEAWVVGNFNLVRHIVNGRVEDVALPARGTVSDAWFAHPDDGYFVGNFVDDHGGTWAHPKLFHWNGRAFDEFPLPVTPYMHELKAIDGTSPSDIWIVSELLGADYGTVLSHWDGAAWQNHEFHQEFGAGVVAFAPNDVWWTGRDGAPLLAHFDGTCWMRQRYPSADEGPPLREVDPRNGSFEYVGTTRGSVIPRAFSSR